MRGRACVRRVLTRVAIACVGLAALPATSFSQTFADGSAEPRPASSVFGLRSGPRLSLTSRTVFHAYQVQLQPLTDDSALRNLNRFYQTLDIGGWSLIGGDVDVVMSLRYDTDFGTGFRRDTPPGEAIPNVDGRDDFDLLFAYVEWRNVIPRRLDLRFGRQVLMDDLAWYSLDGLTLTGHLYRDGENYVDMSVYAGLPVQFEVFFSSEPLLNDGIEEYDGSDFLGGLTFGGSMAARLFRDLSASIAYRQELVLRRDNLAVFPGEIGEERSEGKLGLQESRFGASLGYTVRSLSLDIYARLNWDLLLGALEQARAGVAYNPVRGVHAQVEYLRVRPRFAGDSIFNFFNIFPYDRGRAEVNWEVLPGLELHGGYLLQVFSGDSVPLLDGSGNADFDGSDLSHGPMGGVRYRTSRWGAGVYAEASTNTGGDIAYGGTYRMAWVYGDVSFLRQRLTVDGRVSVTQTQNDWFEGADDGEVDDVDTSVFLNLGLRARILSFLTSRVTFVRNFGSYLAGDYRVYGEMAVRY